MYCTRVLPKSVEVLALPVEIGSLSNVTLLDDDPSQ